jgi:hypothetical protein
MTQIDELARIKEQFRDDYGFARVHLAWVVRNGEVRHLFGLVELLPLEFPEPDNYEPGSKNLGNSGWSIGYKRIGVTVEDALDYYAAFCSGRVLAFDDSSLLDRGREIQTVDVSAATKPFSINDFIVPAVDGGDTPPYLAGWQVCPRIHECKPQIHIDLSGLLGNKNHNTNAISWLKGFVYFDLGAYSEYLGSAVLVAPNPVFRDIDSRLSDIPDKPNEESVIIRLHPRKGKTVSGLKAVCTESETGKKVEAVFEDNFVKLLFQSKIIKVADEIVCPKRGTLYRTVPLGFIRDFRVNLSLHSRTVEFNIVDQITGKGERVIHQRHISVEKETIPQPTPPQIRSQKKEGDKYQQFWFGDNGHGEAKSYIQTLLDRARREAWIVDPYFGGRELLRYFHAGSDWAVPLNILTSAEFLRTKRESGSPTEHGDTLLHAVDELISHASELSQPQYNIRVMEGDKSPIHDRFIAIDNDIWSIGSSLNELGSRGTLTLRLPDPAMVMGKINEAWKCAKPFDAWIENRKANRSKPVNPKGAIACVKRTFSRICGYLKG